MEHKSISFNNELNTIDVTFQTNATEGLILFAADHKERGDFIQLSVVGGKLEFRFDPGDSLVFIRSDQNVNTGETITATATYVLYCECIILNLQPYCSFIIFYIIIMIPQ